VWLWLTGIAFGAAVFLVAGLVIQARLRTGRLYAEACQQWTAAVAADREGAMRSLLNRPGLNGPAWYLCGCACLQEYRAKQAARAFGMAHHADSNLETAALLTFACLKAADGQDSDLVEQITTTWQEMKNPDILHRQQDRLLLDCLEATCGQAPASLSPLGRLAWLVVGPVLRDRIERLVTGDDACWAPLRSPAHPRAT
jgi:hypothetical protein